MSRYTRSGIRRAGDDYQDAVALQRMVEFLEHPDRFTWIEVEADDAGHLDDVKAVDSQNRYYLTQVKFSAHPEKDEDTWTWEKLLAKKTKRSKSLLEKWSSSFFQLANKGEVKEASVLTNRRASGNLNYALNPNGFLELEKVTEPEVRQILLEQIGNEQNIAQFFQTFQFDLDCGNLSTIETGTYKRFLRLSGNKKGWLNLKEELRRWVREPNPSGKITHQDILKAALLDAPSSESYLHYQTWLKDKSSTFSVPGFGITLPIDKAWIQLQVIGKEVSSSPARRESTLIEWIKTYHEWERLSEQRDRDGPSTIPAHLLINYSGNQVVVGGPGAGKSTLLRRIAHASLQEEKSVLWVRLPLLKKRYQVYGNFEDALFDTAIDSSSISGEQLKSHLPEPNILLVDGLDECDPGRADVASALLSWQKGHPNTKIILTTRPVGHEPGFLPGWQHLDVLPLSKEHVQSYAQRLLENMLPPNEATQQLDNFASHVKSNKVVSLAVRNPLLLSYVLLLTVEGLPISERRAELYNSITQIILKRSPSDRDSHVSVNESLALYILHIAGWYVLNNPTMTRSELVNHIGLILMSALGVLKFNAMEQAEEWLNFWEERRVIERLSVGQYEAVTFVHFALGEWAAATYLENLDDDSLKAWLVQNQKKPRFREVITLAAKSVNRIIPLLLDSDDGSPTASESILAAELIVESAEVQENLIVSVIEKLAGKLLSPISLIIGEAAHALLKIAPLQKNMLINLVEPLSHHESAETKAAAIRLLIECGVLVPFEAIEALLVKPHSKNHRGESLSKTLHRDRYFSSIRQDLIAYAIECLAEEPKNEKAEKKLEVFLTNNVIRSTISWGASTKLLELGYMDVYEKIFGTYLNALKEMGDFAKTIEAMKIVEVSLLTRILKATRQNPISGKGLNIKPEDMYSLGTMMSYLKFYERPAGEVWGFLQDTNDDATDAVLRAIIDVTGINPNRLAQEANNLLQQQAREEAGVKNLLFDVPRFPVKPNYAQSLHKDISADLLVKALEHPSDNIGESAVDILQNCFESSVIAEPLKTLLTNTEDKVLYRIALLADHAWKEEAAQIILDWLDGSPHPNQWFLAVLPDLEGAQTDARTFHHLFRGLSSVDGALATYAMRALKEFSDTELQPYIDILHRALEKWTEVNREDEHRHALSGKTAHTIPPSPVNDLLNVIYRLKAVAFGNLVERYQDGGYHEKQTASSLLVKMAIANDTHSDELLSLVNRGDLSSQLLAEFLKADNSILKPVKEKLLQLHKSLKPGVRRVLVESLANAQWLEIDRAIALAHKSVQDEDSFVRDAAVDTLRKLTNRE
jgi:NACHT domain/Cap4 dsDNA endonuclease